jgi:hypothetical protein
MGRAVLKSRVESEFYSPEVVVTISPPQRKRYIMVKAIVRIRSSTCWSAKTYRMSQIRWYEGTLRLDFEEHPNTC